MNKKARISIAFILVLVVCLTIYFYIGDKKTAWGLFGAYVGIRILLNFVGGRKNDRGYPQQYYR